MWLLDQDLSNPAILAESQYSPLTKTFTVGLKHLGFQKFQWLTLSTFQGQEDDVSISSLALLQMLQTVQGRLGYYCLISKTSAAVRFYRSHYNTQVFYIEHLILTHYRLIFGEELLSARSGHSSNHQESLMST